MMSDFSISIIIPCYNDSQYLGECLQSILAQTFKHWEAIVVDDASTDGDVRAIVEGFHDPRIRFVRHEQNRGPAAARNTGVRHAVAQIIVPLDADDRLSPIYLEVILENLRDQSVDFVYCDVQCFGDSTTIWRSRPFDPVAVVCKYQYILGTAPFRREVWTRCGGWCEEPVFRSYEDNDFWLSVIQQGFRGVYVAQPLYQYRISVGTLSAQPRIYVLPIYHRLYKRHKDLIDRYSSYSEWMAIGLLEVAGGYLRLKKPLMAFVCGMRIWITSTHKRLEAKDIIKSSLILAKGKVTESFRTCLSKLGRLKKR